MRKSIQTMVFLGLSIPLCYTIYIGLSIFLLLYPTFSLTEANMPCLPPDPFYADFAHKAPAPGTRNIPHLIHNLWKDNSIPAAWNTTFYSCHDLVHVNWDFRWWTDETARAFVAEEFPWFLEQYDRYKYPIQRVDAARYLIVYHFGGVYMDLDIGCRLPLDLITDQGWSGVMGLTEPNGVSNDLLMFSPKHPFLKYVIDGLTDADRWYGPQYLTVMASAGPVYLSNKYALWEKDHDPTTTPIIMIPPHLYQNALKSFFFHVQGNSWHGPDAVLFLFIAQHFRALVVMAAAVLVVAAILIYSTRRRRYR